MPRRYFELHDDVQVPGRWHLDTPTDNKGREVRDPDRFRQGTPVQMKGRLKIHIEEPGRPLDFTEAGLRIPVVHVKVAALFTELAPGDVQLIPVDIDGHPDQYLVLVAIRLIRCIDEKASRIQLWTHEDGVPEKVGHYASVRDLHIDKTRVGNARMLRPEGWTGALIVSEELKTALESMKATGLKFTEV
ncbi:imm11 family protein [Corallococcus terminator]